jgi:hypothetical protein
MAGPLAWHPLDTGPLSRRVEIPPSQKEALMHRPVVALNLPRTPKDAIVYAKSVAIAFTGNPYLPSPPGETWIDLPPTLQANTSLSGLALGTRTFFRLRVQGKDGLGDWSEVVSLIVT